MFACYPRHLEQSPSPAESCRPRRPGAVHIREDEHSAVGKDSKEDDRTFSSTEEAAKDETRDDKEGSKVLSQGEKSASGVDGASTTPATVGPAPVTPDEALSSGGSRRSDPTDKA